MQEDLFDVLEDRHRYVETNLLGLEMEEKNTQIRNNIRISVNNSVVSDEKLYRRVKGGLRVVVSPSKSVVILQA